MTAAAYPFDLGAHGRAASTASPEAQTWFDRGLVWSYAFHHEEAVRCFEAAIERDPGFAMAHWGLAYAAGPNYNKPWEAFDEVDLRASLRRTHEASVRAAHLAPDAAPVERDLIAALRHRYPSPEPGQHLGAATRAYADAMTRAPAAHREALDSAPLCPAARMNLTPGALGNSRGGGPAEGA